MHERMREGRLELPPLAGLDPKSSASANSATRAAVNELYAGEGSNRKSQWGVGEWSDQKSAWSVVASD